MIWKLRGQPRARSALRRFVGAVGDSNLRSVYANIVNDTGTREEIVLLFGIPQAWHSDQKEVAVQLLDCVMLNPCAAKWLNLMLMHVLREFEAHYGPLKTDAGQAAPGETLPSSS